MSPARSGAHLLGLLLLAACSDYSVQKAPPTPPEDPPEAEPHPFGEPPDWERCTQGWMASYSNLAVDHPGVQAELPQPVLVDTGVVGDSGDTAQPQAVEDQGWWDQVSFSSFEHSLEYGPGWAPVDEGWPEDPRYFAVRFWAWLRVTDRATYPFVLGASSDVWLDIGQTRVIELHDSPYDPKLHSIELRPGVYPIELRYLHRAGDEQGLRFRFTEGDLQICPGER